MAFSGRGIVRVDRTHSPEPQLLIRQVNIAAKTPLDEIWTPAPSPLPLPLPLPLHRCVDSDLFSISNLSQPRNVPWLRWGGGSGMGERWSNGGGGCCCFTLLLLYFLLLSQWDFFHGKFELPSLWKAICDRVALPNPDCMLGVLVFLLSTELRHGLRDL